MSLCFAVGLAFALGVVLLDIPDSSRNPLPRIEPASLIPSTPVVPAQFAVGAGTLAKIGAFMAYRGYAAVTVTIAVAVIVIALIALSLFVPDRRTRKILLWVLLGQILVAVLANLGIGSGMSAAVSEMLCTPARPAPSWDVCSIERIARPGFLSVHYGFNAVIDAVCVAATATVVFAIFIVASVRPPPGLPAMVRSAERCVTVLLVAASMLLVSVALHDKSFLHWAFADFLALERPPKDIAAYVAGMATLNGALETALLAVTWLISLLLLGRSGRGPSDPEEAFGGFSVYNLSAIFAPALSAIAANLLSAQ